MKAIFCLEENYEPASLVAKAYGLEVIIASCKKFSGREVLLSFDKIPTVDEAIIVHQLFPNPADKIIELLLMIDALENNGIKKATLISAYIPYLRQDRELAENSAVASRMLAKIIDSSIINKIITVDCHSQKGIDFFKTEIVNLDPSEFFAGILHDKISDSIVISPDLGSCNRAAKLSELLDLPYVVLEKTRSEGGVVVQALDRHSEVVRSTVVESSLQVYNSKSYSTLGFNTLMNGFAINANIDSTLPTNGAALNDEKLRPTAIIIDDIIDSGATIIATLEAIKNSFEKIFVCATHIINIEVKEKIESMYGNVEIITTNSTNCSNKDKLENIWVVCGRSVIASELQVKS